MSAKRLEPRAGHRLSGSSPLFGCTLSARAARELQDQAGIDAATIARLQGELDRGHTLQRGDVLIVDEAGELREVRRQRHRWDRDALTALRDDVARLAASTTSP